MPAPKHTKPSAARKAPPLILVLIAAAVFLVTIIFATNAMFKLPDPPPRSWYGTWQSVDADMDMVATISKDEINILWKTEEGDAIYWVGTFPVEPRDPRNGDKVVSNANREALEFSLLASQDKEKLFTLNEGLLEYSFSAFGMTKTVRLKQK